jgi:acyl-CoA thioester hydrolase
MLDDFPVMAEVPVRWGDIDLLGHVNNIMYLQYFETARIEYLMRAGLQAPGAAWSDFGFIVASVYCRYKAPVTFPDTLLVGARVWGLGTDRMVIHHSVYSQKLRKTAATGDVLLVAYDFKAGRRTSIPADIKAAIVTIEGRELPEPPPLRQLRCTS